MTRVLITDGISPRAASRLREMNFEVDESPTLTVHELTTRLGAYQAIAVRSATRLDWKLLQQAAGRLRLVVRGGVGIDNIDLEAASKAGIAVANTPGANTIATAELTMALMLALARNLMPAHNSITRGEWERKRFTGIELSGKTLGILGFGRIGREVGRRAKAFGMNVLAHDPYLTATAIAENGATAAPFEQVLEQADFITLHVPLTPETRHLIDATAFARMRHGVRLINCARGGLIDEDAAVQALRDGKLSGLALDVYAQEPPQPDSPLLADERVIHIPHLGASTLEAQEKVAEEIVNVLADFFIKRKFDAVLNRSALDL